MWGRAEGRNKDWAGRQGKLVGCLDVEMVGILVRLVPDEKQFKLGGSLKDEHHCDVWSVLNFLKDPV